MADQVVLSPFLGVVFDNLISFAKSEIGLVLGVNKEMEKLSGTLSTIRAVLNDAEEKQVTNEAIRKWLSELKDTAYDADDVLDECAFEGLQLASEMRKNGIRKQVVESFKQSKLRRRIAKRIKELRERFDEIAAEKFKFDLIGGIKEGRVGYRQNRETSSLISETQVYGRDGDKKHLVQLLLNNVNSEEDLSICPIVGLGGLGKTTLAQLVYNDERVAKHFHVRPWVCVSDNFDFRRLIKAIIVSLSGKACSLEDLQPLQHCLQDELRGKRFLLVLDDVWTDDRDDWNQLKALLNNGVKGSSIIVTTRSISVAYTIGTLPYDLQHLSDDDCWSLFRQCAFGLGNEERPALVRIGKEIVRKCGGVPLASKALGGFLRSKNVEIEWVYVRDSRIWDIPSIIMPALRLSYNHLPSDLKQCFAYCSIFPKNSKIKKQELIHLWMANGFVQSKGRMTMEDVGNENFNELLWRSFFQEIDKDKEGRIVSCKMHDLMHDLASHIAGDEYFIMDDSKGEKNITRRTRHLAMHSSTQAPASMLEAVPKSSPCLRSLIKFDGFPYVGNLEFIFPSLARLRALDLRQKSVTVLPHSVGELKHLRYLNLSHTDIILLPESICRLQNVQTLNLRGCSELRTLPANMRKMINLRHLDIWGCHQLSNMPIEMGKLTCLQTLGIFIVSAKKGCGIEELQGLNLGGDLEIKGLEHVKNSKNAKLYEKEHLLSLWLSWSQSHLEEQAPEVIEDLQPHLNLRRLSMLGYNGRLFPKWLTASSLPNLVEISLSECRRCECLPPLGILPFLKVLELSSMDSVKFIDDVGYCGKNVADVELFPSLEKLVVESMPNLEGWSSSQRALMSPCLKILSLSKCPQLRTFQLQPEGFSIFSLKSLSIEHCHLLKQLPKLEMSSLDYMSVDDCAELEFSTEYFQNPVDLRILTLKGLPKLTCFPEGIKHALMLQVLSVQSCSKDLMDLPDWIGSLTSLQALWIDGCQKRKVMPEGLQNLTYLQILQIRGCSSALEKRCEKQMGEDWCKISHIPQVLVSSAPPE